MHNGPGAKPGPLGVHDRERRAGVLYHSSTPLGSGPDHPHRPMGMGMSTWVDTPAIAGICQGMPAILKISRELLHFGGIRGTIYYVL